MNKSLDFTTKVILSLNLALGIVLIVGLIQTHQNNPARSCTQTPANFGYTEFNCKSGHNFFEQK